MIRKNNQLKNLTKELRKITKTKKIKNQSKPTKTFFYNDLIYNLIKKYA